jgi:beta-aspartyl-peptidase (threonine type)
MNKLCIFAILVLGCSISLYGQTELQKQRIASEIRAVMDGQVVAWNRGDIEAFMQGYWNSENLVFVSTNVTRGWKPTLERYKERYDSREKMGTLTFSDLEITVLSKDSAVVLGSWELVRTSDNPKGKFTLIFRRLKEGWRIVHDHTS